MLVPLSPGHPGIAANAGILARNLFERALCKMTGKTVTGYSLPAGCVGAGNLHTRAFLEVGGGPLQVLTSLLAMAALVRTSGALVGVFSHFF